MSLVSICTEMTLVNITFFIWLSENDRENLSLSIPSLESQIVLQSAYLGKFTPLITKNKTLRYLTYLI